jgi:hypothetical protein
MRCRHLLSKYNFDLHRNCSLFKRTAKHNLEHIHIRSHLERILYCQECFGSYHIPIINANFHLMNCIRKQRYFRSIYILTYSCTLSCLWMQLYNKCWCMLSRFLLFCRIRWPSHTHIDSLMCSKNSPFYTRSH